MPILLPLTPNGCAPSQLELLALLLRPIVVLEVRPPPAPRPHYITFIDESDSWTSRT